MSASRTMAKVLYAKMCQYVGPDHEQQCIEKVLTPWIEVDGKRIAELEAENKALKGQIKLMDTKARGSFNCFWNGGWYSLDSYTPPKEGSSDENT